ncbi:hypothetical protein [Bartonella tribocorum]|uniref:hypothetical protein n=1 Tax=Bartonella tribocorum TaxID=85701 RepID=UPI001AEC83FF|nr:hypothetical protein [Bartonella tribocorum]
MIQQEKYGGKEPLKGVFIALLTNINIFYETSPPSPNNEYQSCLHLETPIKKLLKTAFL